MRKFLFILIMLFTSLHSHATQVQITRQINVLQRLLNQSRQDTGRISLLLEAGLWYVYKPGAARTDMDSAMFFTNQALKLSKTLNAPVWEGRCCFVYANICREKGNVQGGKAYAQKAIDICTRYNNKSWLADAYMEMTNYHNPFLLATGAEILRLSQLAAKLYTELGNLEKEAETYQYIADIRQIAGQNSKGIEDALHALDIFTRIHYQKLQGVYDLLGKMYEAAGNHEDALKYELLAMQAAERMNDSSWLCPIYNHMGKIYYNLKQYEPSLKFYGKSFDIADMRSDTISVITIGFNIVNANNLTGKSAENIALLKMLEKKYPIDDTEGRALIYCSYLLSYLELNNNRSAKIYLDKLLDISARFEVDESIQLYIYQPVIKYYLKTGQYEEAQKYCASNDSLYKRLGYVNDYTANYLMWYRADSALGNKIAALAHFKAYANLKDSMLNEVKSQQISQLQIKYETDKKEQDIQLLTRQSQLQKSMLTQARQTKNVILGGAIMLVLLLGISYNRYRLKQRSNTALAAKQEEINRKNESLNELLKEKEWLMKEMHHRVKNNLQIVISLLNTQSLYLDNEAAQLAIRESQHRMHTISLIHQKLYQSDNSAIVNMQAYIYELIDYLRESLNASSAIRFEKQIEDIELDVAQAIPIGLILNEAITNSIKYAFPDKSGIISIFMKISPAGNIVLQIGDNGIGLSANEPMGKSGSMGMSLMSGLASQLGSTYTIRNDNGLKIALEFPYIKEVNREIE